MINKNKILLVDGMALLFRGFYATAYSRNFMVNSKGIPTNGIFGFLNYFLHAIKTFEPSHVISCWDMGSKTFRTEIFPDYKANRGEPPVELIPQFDLVKKVMDAFEVPNIGVIGYEADDCIGTLAKQYSNDSEVLILTGDQDILQLVDDQISVAIMKKGQGNYAVFDKDNFFEQKGISPSQMIDLKALMGDPSDNYPGVKGIGEKIALKLLSAHQTTNGILTNLDSLAKGVRNKIEQSIDDLHLSRKLATIYCDVPITCDLKDAEWNVDVEKVKQAYVNYEVKNLKNWTEKVG